MIDYADALRTLIASLGDAAVLGIVVIVAFAVAAGLSFLFASRAPKSTHRWPK
jgi:hypothetical protein